MREEAERGLEWRREYGRGGTEVGVARARDISNGADLSMDTVRRMASYFARHEVDKEAEGFRPGEDGYPSAGRIAWALWGGDPGKSWANRILREEELDTDRKRRSSAGSETVLHSGQIQEVQMADREVRSRIEGAEIRADGDEIRVSGYAAVFDETTEIAGMFQERIARGAFRNALDRGDDTVFLVNHEGLPLARTRSGTMTLTEDERGLFMETVLDGNDPDVRAIVPKMKRGDLDKMSFAFRADVDEWDDTGAMPVRTVKDLRLYDVSIVTNPAYDGTEIGLRSLQQHQQANPKSQAARRLRMKAKLIE